MLVPANLFWEDGFLLGKINLKKKKKENLKLKHILGLQHRLHRYTCKPRNIIGMDEQRRFDFFLFWQSRVRTTIVGKFSSPECHACAKRKELWKT